MHEDAVATIREVERHGLILPIGLGTLWVGDTQVYLLSDLIQRCKRLATAIDALCRSQCEYGIHASGIIRATLDERER